AFSVHVLDAVVHVLVHDADRRRHAMMARRAGDTAFERALPACHHLRLFRRFARKAVERIGRDGQEARGRLAPVASGAPEGLELGDARTSARIEILDERVVDLEQAISDRGAAELRALAPLCRPRLLVPEEVVIRKGERGVAMFLISSGAVEVVLPSERVRLGSGDFFGEMALLSGRPRLADVVALGYCRVLVLSAAEFRRFLRDYPRARAEIDRVAEERARANQEKVPI